VILLEHSTVTVGVFKFKFEYPIYSIFRKKSLIVLGLFHYKYWSAYLLCGRLQWERTAVESLNFLTLCHGPTRGMQVRREKNKSHANQPCLTTVLRFVNEGSSSKRTDAKFSNDYNIIRTHTRYCRVLPANSPDLVANCTHAEHAFNLLSAHKYCAFLGGECEWVVS